jgi:hypothetical protein
MSINKTNLGKKLGNKEYLALVSCQDVGRFLLFHEGLGTGTVD